MIPLYVLDELKELKKAALSEIESKGSTLIPSAQSLKNRLEGFASYVIEKIDEIMEASK